MEVQALQGYNNTLPSSETEQGSDNLADANLQSYPIYCTSASCADSIEVSFSVVPSGGIELATFCYSSALLTDLAMPQQSTKLYMKEILILLIVRPN